MGLSNNRFYKKIRDLFSRREPEYNEMITESKNEIIQKRDVRNRFSDIKEKFLEIVGGNIKLILRSLALIIILPLSILLILSLLVNPTVLKSNLQITLDKQLEGDFRIEGEVKTRFLFSPKIVINKPILKNAIYDGHPIDVTMEAMVINVGFFSLFSNNPKISKLQLISPVVKYSLSVEKTLPTSQIAKDLGDKEIKTIDEKIAENILPPNSAEISNLEKSDIEQGELQQQDLDAAQEHQSPLEEKDLEKNGKNNTSQKLALDEIKDEEKPQNLVYNDSSFTSKIFKFGKNSNQTFNIKDIKVIEVEKGSFKKTGLGNEAILDIKNINFVSKNNIKSQNLDIFGQVFFNNIPTQFNLSLNVDSGYSQLAINSTIFQLKLEGEFFDSNINDLSKSNFSGKIEGEIFSPKDFVNKYISKYSLIYGRIGTTNSIKLSAKINSDKGNYIISNINVTSPILVANGEVNVNLSQVRTAINSKINIAKIDLDNIWSARFSDYSPEIIKFESTIIDNFLDSERGQINQENQENVIGPMMVDENLSFIIDRTLPQIETINQKSIFKNVDFNLSIKANNIKYHEKNITNADINLITSPEGDLQINRTTMNIPDGGLMEINGSFKNQNNVSSFVGSYKIDGKDFSNFISWMNFSSEYLKINPEINYNLSGEIMMLSNFSALKNLTLDIDNSKNLVKANIRYDSSKDIENIDFEVAINDLNLEDYFNISLERNSYVSPGYLSQKFLWLNTIASNNNIYINIDKLKYRDHVFLNQELNFSVKPSVLNLDNLSFKSEDGVVDMRISTNIDLTAKPNLMLDLEINNFHYVAGDLEDNGKLSRLPFSQRFFLLPTIADFDGKITFKSNKFFIDDIEISNILLDGDLKKGIFNIKDGQLNIDSGNFKYNGEIVLRKIKSINGQFVYTEVNNNKLLFNLLGLKNISGVSNIAGILNANGQNLEDFVKSLDVKLQFVAADVKIEDFGLEELLKQMLLLGRSQPMMDNPKDILFSKKYQTTFKDVKGTLEINKDKNQLKISSSSPAINSVTIGSINLPEKSLNLSSQMIFLTGTRQRQIPITIIVTNIGNLLNLENNANLSQVEQYISQIQTRNESMQQNVRPQQ